jgi:hypothetical protein
VGSTAKYLLDGSLVVLIIVLVWTRRWLNNRNGDRPD